MELRRSRRSRGSYDESTAELEADMTTRSKRLSRSAATSASASALVTVSRSEVGFPEEPVRSLRLTLKMPSGKLQDATGGRSGRRSVNVFREDPIVSGPRASRNKKRVVEVATSDDEDLDDQEEDEVDDDEDALGEDDEDADADADGDLDMDDAPPQPPIRRAAKVAASARVKSAKSVEAKEMDLEDEEEDEDDDDLSETESDAEGEADEQDETAIPDINVDELDEEDEEDDLEGDLESDAMAIDNSKQTKRQRGNLGDDFLQLPMGAKTLSLLHVSEDEANKWTEPQIKKHLTAEERAMRRAEMARRRKNLSEKRNEEEKVRQLFTLLARTLNCYFTLALI